MSDKRVLDYTNKTDREAFDLWLNECPVQYEYNDTINDGDDIAEWYFFRIPKEEEEDNDEPKTRLEQMGKLTHDPIVD